MRWWAYICFIFALNGCDSSHQSRTPSPVKADPPQAPVATPSLSAVPKREVVVGPPESAVAEGQKGATLWMAEQVHLRCPSGNCPAQVGLLQYAIPPTAESQGLWSRRRCVGTLISPTTIISNAHCEAEGHEGHFILGSGRSREIRRIKSVVRRWFTEGSGRLAVDVAIFELELPITLVQPLNIANGPQKNFGNLVGYVINRDGDGFRIDQLNCEVRRHETIFPVDIIEGPNLIYGFGCVASEGNSGSPFFAPGSMEVQAIQQSIMNAQIYRDIQRREPKLYENHNAVLLSNLRCLDIAGRSSATCLSLNSSLIQERWNALLDDTFAKDRPSVGTAGVQYVAQHFAIEDLRDDRFEVFYLPDCRPSDVWPQAIDFPSRHVRIVTDHWAKPLQIEVLDQRVNLATVLRSNGIRGRVQIRKWSAPFAKLSEQDEKLTPRVDRGAEPFSIDLPLCAR